MAVEDRHIPWNYTDGLAVLSLASESRKNKCPEKMKTFYGILEVALVVLNLAGESKVTKPL